MAFKTREGCVYGIGNINAVFTDIEPYLSYYKDKESISEWARGEMAFSVKENIIDVAVDGMLLQKPLPLFKIRLSTHYN